MVGKQYNGKRSVFRSGRQKEESEQQQVVGQEFIEQEWQFCRKLRQQKREDRRGGREEDQAQGAVACIQCGPVD